MDWVKKRFDELGFIGRGRSKHRPRNDESLYGGIYPFIQTSEVKAANLYIMDYTKTYNDKGLGQSKLWSPNTLCITIAANIAETAILGIEACFPDSIIGFVADTSNCDVHFIKYYFDIVQKQMQQVSQGATQDNLSLNKLLNFKVPTPPLPTQHKIASILSSYDDLIENNLKRIKLLEEAAQNIYKEWFVRFRFPGHEDTKLSDSELPKGWERKTLSQLCNSIEDGDWIESKDQNGSDYRLIQVSNIGVNSFVETNKWRWITEDTFSHLRCREIEDGDIIVSRMPNGIGRSWLVNKMDFKMVTVVDVAIVKPNLKLTSKYYLNEKFNSIVNIQLCESLAGGTTRKRISKKTLASIEHLNPDKKILNNFDEVISSIYFLKSKLFKQNQILKEARDILLPRLMDRRIEV